MSNITILGAYNLGCYSHKGDITFPILADVDGTHLMNYKNKGNYFTNYNLGVNESGFSVTNIFNEDSTVLMQITKPNGNLLKAARHTTLFISKQKFTFMRLILLKVK